VCPEGYDDDVFSEIWDDGGAYTDDTSLFTCDSIEIESWMFSDDTPETSVIENQYPDYFVEANPRYTQLNYYDYYDDAYYVDDDVLFTNDAANEYQFWNDPLVPLRRILIPKSYYESVDYAALPSLPPYFDRYRDYYQFCWENDNDYDDLFDDYWLGDDYDCYYNDCYY